jgi:predicted nucleotidyltransferase
MISKGQISLAIGHASGDPVLDEIVPHLVETFEPEPIYLFGSRARGERGPDSDYDLIVVVCRSDLPGLRREQLAYRILRGVGAARDALVWTTEEFDRLQPPASLPATTEREGRKIYVLDRGESFEPSVEARGELSEPRLVYDSIAARPPADVRP